MAQKTEHLTIGRRRITVSNLDKILYPGNKFTKAKVIDYYIRISKFLLPHLKDRPVTLKRFPDGVFGEAFYEKDAPAFTPEWVKTVAVPRRETAGPDIRYILINDLPTLVWVANYATLELHTFLHRAQHLNRPTSMVFDCDPGEGADILNCARVALLLRDTLKELGFDSYVKVSGSKGLQVYVPLNSPVTYDETQPLAKGIAQLMAQREPKLIVWQMPKHLRNKKVFIDWSQNTDYKTTISVYSLRAKIYKPYVSMPVEWGELSDALQNKNVDALFFTPEEAITRAEERRDFFKPVMEKVQKFPADLRRYFKQKQQATHPLPRGGTDLMTRKRPSHKSRSTEAHKSRSTEAHKSRSTEAHKSRSTEAHKSRSTEAHKSQSTEALKPYAAKRDFSKTPEPSLMRQVRTKTLRSSAPRGRSGVPRGSRQGSRRRFVIQKHAASHLHYDFRLEMHEVLKSWSVPKGPPYKKDERRLAMPTEDHPIEYLDFEGVIPKSQYGGGTVMVWDIGTYELIEGNYYKGFLRFYLAGTKLKGEWTLNRFTPGRDERDNRDKWHLIKSERSTRAVSKRRDDESALTKRTMAQIAAAADAVWQSNRR